MSKIINIGKNAGNLYIGEAPEYKVGSAINELLNILAERPFQFSRIRRIAPASTLEKINHNKIQSKRFIIKQYLDHSAAIEAAYLGINSIIPFGRDIILQNLHDLYLSCLDDLGIDYLCGEVDIEGVRGGADYILESIIQKLKNTVFETKNSPSLREQIEQGVNVVVAHAFIECVIFEVPK